jgi:hypothetical protein
MGHNVTIGWLVACGIVVLCWWQVRGRRLKTSAIASRLGRPIASHWNIRTVVIKMTGCALIAAVLVAGSAMITSIERGDKAARALGAPALAAWVIFAALAGAVAGYCLALSDLVLQRRMMGQRVHPLLRAYFSAGIFSLILWSVTLFAVGLAGIVFYYSFLSPGPGRAG